jgi:uncharacterized damage-inducible protein DinB
VSEVANWFGRKFEFSFPLELYPNLCVRLRGTPARLEELVQNRPRAQLVRREQEKWSIQEQAGHLLDLESLWSARVDDFLGSSGQLTAADLTNRKTHEAGHNDREVGEILSEFRKARLKLLDRLQGLGADAFSRAMLHPRLQQPMRLVDHLCFVAEHDDHHLARIWELAQTG